MRELSGTCRTMALALALLLAGCATTANYETTLDSWTGRSADDLIRAWGAPTGTMQMPGGNTLLVYERGSSYTTPTTVTPGQTTGRVIGNTYYATTSPGRVSGGQRINFWCKTEFEVDGSGQLVRWRYEGNRCAQ
jgi:hypothetical protein